MFCFLFSGDIWSLCSSAIKKKKNMLFQNAYYFTQPFHT